VCRCLFFVLVFFLCVLLLPLCLEEENKGEKGEQKNGPKSDSSTRCSAVKVVASGRGRRRRRRWGVDSARGLGTALLSLRESWAWFTTSSLLVSDGSLSCLRAASTSSTASAPVTPGTDLTIRLLTGRERAIAGVDQDWTSSTTVLWQDSDRTSAGLSSVSTSDITVRPISPSTNFTVQFEAERVNLSDSGSSDNCVQECRGLLVHWTLRIFSSSFDFGQNVSRGRCARVVFDINFDIKLTTRQQSSSRTTDRADGDDEELRRIQRRCVRVGQHDGDLASGVQQAERSISTSGDIKSDGSSDVTTSARHITSRNRNGEGSTL